MFEKTGGHGGSTAKERRNLKKTRGCVTHMLNNKIIDLTKRQMSRDGR